MKKELEVAAPTKNNFKETKKTYKPPVLQVFGELRRLTQAVGSKNGDAGQNMMVSERRAKQKIRRVGVHPLSIGIYSFQYSKDFSEEFGSGRQLGVMADEVEKVLPEAVSTHRDGFKRVDYGMLHQAAIKQLGGRPWIGMA